MFACDAGSSSEPSSSGGQGSVANNSGGLSGSPPLSAGSAGDSGGAAGGIAGAPAGTAGSPAQPAGGGTGCAGAIYCDDFEAYATGPASTLGSVWSVRTSSGTVSVDETQHRSGSKAVKFTTEGKGGVKTAFLALKGASIFPVPGNTFYGRMLFFLESAPTDDVHWTLFQATGTVPGETYRAQYRYGGQYALAEGNQWMANYETPDSYAGVGPSSDCWLHSNGAVIPTARWACVEWKFDGAQNQMSFWLDGVAYDDLSMLGTGQGCVAQDETFPWTAPTFSELEIGWESYQSDAARTLYIDDVAISTSRIGCPE